MKKIGSILLLLLLLSCVRKNPEYKEWSLSLDNSKDSVTYIFAEKFKEELELSSKGKIHLTLYPNAVLGGDRESIESCQMGDITFVLQNTAPQVNFVPQVAVFDLFHIFPNIETARKVLDGPFLEEMKPYYQKKKLICLGYSDQHFREMTSNREIKNIDDFRGLKIRTMENPNHILYWSSLGANPTPMVWGEVYIALQQHNIDAQENPYESIVASKVYEQQKYIIETHHIVHLVSLIMNEEVYLSLNEEEKHWVEDAAKAAIAYSRQQADLRIEDRKKIVTDYGVKILPVSDNLREEMMKRAEKANDKIIDKVGTELVDDLFKEIERVQND